MTTWPKLLYAPDRAFGLRGNQFEITRHLLPGTFEGFSESGAVQLRLMYARHVFAGSKTQTEYYVKCECKSIVLYFQLDLDFIFVKFMFVREEIFVL